MTIHGPTANSFISQRLRLHYVDWGNPDAPPLILQHGGRDRGLGLRARDHCAELAHGHGMQSDEPSTALAAAYGVLATAGPDDPVARRILAVQRLESPALGDEFLG